MTKIHFYKIYSRLGMVNLPFGETTLNLGVEFGPDAVLSEDYLSNFKNQQITEYKFSLPEDINKEGYYKVIAKESEELTNLISETLNEDEIQVAIGGDHSIALSTILVAAKKYGGENVGVIYFDSHGDLHTVESTPSGNFHGMHMRIISDESSNQDLENLTKGYKINPPSILYIGNQVVEDAEIRFMKENNIKNINRKEIINNPSEVENIIINHISKFEHIHISFDIDVLDSSLVTATGIPAKNGLMLEDIIPLLGIIKSNVESYSVDLVELNPKKDGAEETIKIAQTILNNLILN
ncbi:MAG: arginase family protein [Candidatus Dojkabacteria bacterium]